jgi:hypothetical protein
MSKLRYALKEWAVTIGALESGATIMLLRKGGIHEPQPFRLAQLEVLLYPTYEHQVADQLKPQYQHLLPPRLATVSESLTLSACAQITDGFLLQDPTLLPGLLPFHLWTEAFVQERWAWKPHIPLFVLLLRVAKLPQPVIIPYHKRYGGCRSWLELETEIETSAAVPVVSDSAYSLQVAQICELLASCESVAPVF